MTTHLVRYAHAGGSHWGVVRGPEIVPLAGDYATTAALITTGEADWRAAATRAPSLKLAAVTPLSPVTAPARVICQGANYRQHMIESGVDPDAKRFNMFFEKSDASISAPAGAIVRPAHVQLLDYEIELALVMRKPISGPVTVTADTLHEYVFGLTIANDVSARDVQLPQTQFFKGKSYRGFCPLGPYLAVIEGPTLRLGVGLRMFFARARRDPVWSRFVARVGKVGGIEQPMRDLEAGVRIGHFRVPGRDAARDLILGGVRAALERIGAGQTPPAFGEHMTEICLHALRADPRRIAAVLAHELPVLA